MGILDGSTGCCKCDAAHKTLDAFDPVCGGRPRRFIGGTDGIGQLLASRFNGDRRVASVDLGLVLRFHFNTPATAQKILTIGMVKAMMHSSR